VAGRMSRVLVVDDEEGMRAMLTHMLEKEGFKVITAQDGEQAMHNVCFDAPDAVLLDVYLPRLDGMEVLKKIRAVDDGLPVILISGHADIHQAVEAVKEGAYDYLAKPFDNNEVVCITRRAIAERQLGRDLTSTNGRYCGNFGLIETMGPSDKIARLLADVHRVARSDFSVVIVGETGSGKELVARAIHQDSSRAEAPFVPMDCGAIPEPLLESELFGHEKGSFTGADRQTRGKFEQAEGGTLFMDEITNLPIAAQAKFLRVIQDWKLYRIGSLKPLDVHIRLIVAANRDLQEMTAVGTFRKDLYYRLSEFTICIPSLRERK
jgi:DNA-binding NtrC family response regulator